MAKFSKATGKYEGRKRKKKTQAEDSENHKGKKMQPSEKGTGIKRRQIDK